MKEATGELNMTVITLVAVAAVGALFYFLIWPMIQLMVVQQTCNTYGTDWEAVRGTEVINTGSQATVTIYACCPPGQAEIDDNCVEVDAGDAE